MISEGLRKHAFWLYGVIVGLALKQSLEIVVGHLISPPHDSYRDAFIETERLGVFVLTTIQFYLGSVWFFDKYHDNPARPYNNTNFAVDFLFGLLHFLFFFAWAMSIDTHYGHLRLFPVLMLLILMYDSLWCWACKGLDSYKEVRTWSWVNFGVVITAVAVYAVTLFAVTVITGHPISTHHRIGEGVAILPIIGVGIADIVGMITGKQLIADWVLDRFGGYSNPSLTDPPSESS
ncbi:MAG: hypothetical protein QOD33_355 [Pyrinomonadaceae bacterium]|jgi:hypothetical protein|nr:hypothetical protein [Pyrinomonadaceae bacterium]